MQELFYENRHYHAHCFRCFRCDRSLADEPFTSQGDALVCSDCYCNEFSSKCVACSKSVMPGSESEGTPRHKQSPTSSPETGWREDKKNVHTPCLQR